MTALLEIREVRAGYGQSVVLQTISLKMDQGEIVCLLGANGAGKTTTTRVISGLVKPLSGQIFFDGQDIAEVPAHRRVELGISLSPEGRQVFPNFSVQENLLLGSFTKKARQSRSEKLEQVYTLFPRLAERRKQKAGLMSGGEQQMLAIGRALMSCPRLLMLDEPSLGLAPKIILDVYEAVARIAKDGLSILFVEQNVQAALLIAQRGYLLANGRIAAHGASDELRGSPLVQEAFFGKAGVGSADTATTAMPHARSEVHSA